MVCCMAGWISTSDRGLCGHCISCSGEQFVKIPTARVLSCTLGAGLG